MDEENIKTTRLVGELENGPVLLDLDYSEIEPRVIEAAKKVLTPKEQWVEDKYQEAKKDIKYRRLRQSLLNIPSGQKPDWIADLTAQLESEGYRTDTVPEIQHIEYMKVWEPLKAKMVEIDDLTADNCKFNTLIRIS